MQQRKFSVRELCHTAMFVAVMAVCAQLSIFLPGGVPFSFQVWGIALAGLILGPKNGTIAALVYVLLGAAGAPVFVGFTGGFGIIMRHTGGFIVSFPILAYVAGLGARKGGIFSMILGLTVGNFINLAVGLIWFEWILGFGWAVSFGYAVAPFIFVTILQIAVLPILCKSINLALRKARVAV